MATATATPTTTTTTMCAYSSDGRTDRRGTVKAWTMTQRPTWLATSTGGLLFCRIVPPRPSPDRPTQTALHDTHEQHDSTASTRPAPWLRVLAGAAAPAAGEPAAGRQGKGKAKGKGTGRQRLGRSRIETRGIGVRESGRACWPVNPSLAERKWKIQLQAELGGADRKWSQRIALTAPRSRGRWENWEIIKKSQFCQSWASEQGCIANRARLKRGSNWRGLPHIADLSVAVGLELHTSRSRHSREPIKHEHQMVVPVDGGSQH